MPKLFQNFSRFFWGPVVTQVDLADSCPPLLTILGYAVITRFIVFLRVHVQTILGPSDTPKIGAKIVERITVYMVSVHALGGLVHRTMHPYGLHLPGPIGPGPSVDGAIGIGLAVGRVNHGVPFIDRKPPKVVGANSSVEPFGKGYGFWSMVHVEYFTTGGI